ncbi:MAG: hypothetical protein BWZ10_02287 [candidate division BRC1 bacterium ADurb.BinA364]|nr:MAG: hypothetical protein BWZ10_02287 [candidate division BRC1 bacterium ADurb.BinA364]
MNEADILVERQCQVFGGELPGRHGAVAVELPVLVHPLPVELARRLAKMDRENAIDRAQNLFLRGAQIGRRGAGGFSVAQNFGAFAQLFDDAGVHAAAVGGAFGFGHRGLGNQSVFLDNVDEHIPLAAVVDRVREKERHRSVVHRPVGGLDDRLEEIIGALDFVPEKRVILAEFEILEFHFAHRADAAQIESGEHPASSGGLLRGRFPIVQRFGEGMIGLDRDRAVDGDFIDRGFGHGIARPGIGRIGLEIGFQFVQQPGGQCSRRGCPARPPGGPCG